MKHKQKAPAAIAAVPTGWQDVLLVCGKCSKKLRGGFGRGGREALAGELRHALRQAGRRGQTRVLASKCLGLCPKGAVTVLAGRHPGALLAVPGGTDAVTVLARLDPPPLRHSQIGGDAGSGQPGGQSGDDPRG